MGLTPEDIESFKTRGLYDDGYDRATRFMRHGFYGRAKSVAKRGHAYLKPPRDEL